MNATSIIWTLMLAAAMAHAANSQQPTALIDADAKRGGWRFDNGREFPGARGGLELAAEPFRDQPVLALRSDFTEGGNYVQAAVSLPKVPVDTLSLWVNAPAGASSIPIRLIDATGQCHQLKLKLNDKGGWQQITLPVDDYFRKMGTAAALDVASQYEKWGGANDGRWHQPGKLLVVLCPRGLGEKAEVLLSGVQLHPAAATTSIHKTVRLDEMLEQGELDWGFNRGQEFPGAKGGLELVRDQPVQGGHAMRLHADFTGGGAYVGVRKSLAPLNVEAMQAIRIKMRSEATEQFALRLVDATGQCHQQKSIPVKADGKWHDVEIVPMKIAGGEHWGGANDGKWHHPIQFIELMLNVRSSESKKPELYLGDIRADVVIQATPAPATFAESFESSDLFDEQWQTDGDVRIAARTGNDAGQALELKRSLESVQASTSAVSKPFDVAPGMWQVQYKWKSDLHSPDNSYHGTVAMEVLDRGGRVLETIPIGIGFGKSDWQEMANAVPLPSGASRARLRAELKKTYGSFLVDDLSASRLKVQPIEQRIDRILLHGEAMGNLFSPGDEVRFTATVEANRPLPAAQQTLRYRVCDCGGAEQFELAEATLLAQVAKDGRHNYTAELALPAKELAEGRYYELHVQVPQDAGDPVAEYSGFAILPIAASKQHAAEDVPFTIRNWDSRIPAYFHLADRLGLRMLGVWGGWSPDAPYKPHCPGVDICEQLDAKWITGTPASQIERHGFEKYSEESLREGMRNFLKTYAKSGLAMIAMGNEPHGTGEKVLENVRAYRAIYETVKAFDPEIHVIGTSVEPNEEYFRAGYQKYLDSYDFHIYEDYTKVRRTMREYRELMKKYDAVKPIHSTELGLNSQGQTRLAVSREMVKKIVSFFAEGGATVSWFTIMYPDPQGKARGQFGDSHCMFDSKYNLYNPRLDAITHYHLLNAICVKKFAEEKQYDGGPQAYLFRDEQDRCLQVLWLDGGRRDVLLPLDAKGPVQLTYIDGTQQQLQPTGGTVALTLSDDPVMLLYEQPDAKLANTLGQAELSLEKPPAAASPGESVTFTLTGEQADAERLRVHCPPLWIASLRQAGDRRVEVTLDVPPSTTAREATIRIQRLRGSDVSGELSIGVAVASR